MAGIGDLYNQIPAHMRLYLEYMAGADDPITEKDFSKEELATIRAQAAAKKQREQETYKEYQKELQAWRDKPVSDQWQLMTEGEDGEPIYSYERRPPYFIQKPNPKRINVDSFGDYVDQDIDSDRLKVIENSLGRYSVVTDENGNQKVVDGYNFNKEENKYFGLPKEGVGIADLVQLFKNEGRARNIPEILARVLRPDGHRDVEINLGQDDGYR